MNKNKNEINSWTHLNGDPRFHNWALLIPSESIIKLPISSLNEIKNTSFMKSDYIPTNGDAIIYHEEDGSRAYHSATVQLGYCDHTGELWYFVPEAKHKKWLYQNKIITREEFNGSGNHIAAVRILLGIKRMEANQASWESWTINVENPFIEMVKKWVMLEQ